MIEVLNGPFIRAGESLSDVIDCRGGQMVRITMPPEWDDAPLTFEFSSDGLFFNDIFDLEGFAVSIKHVVKGSGVIVPHDFGRAIAFMKFRSGTRGNPVPQSEDRWFAVAVIKPPEEQAPASRSAKKKAPTKKAAKKSAVKKRR